MTALDARSHEEAAPDDAHAHDHMVGSGGVALARS